MRRQRITGAEREMGDGPQGSVRGPFRRGRAESIVQTPPVALRNCCEKPQLPRRIDQVDGISPTGTSINVG